METMTNFIFLGFKITADGDCSHEIKRRLLLISINFNFNFLEGIGRNLEGILINWKESYDQPR